MDSGYRLGPAFAGLVCRGVVIPRELVCWEEDSRLELELACSFSASAPGKAWPWPWAKHKALLQRFHQKWKTNTVLV